MNLEKLLKIKTNLEKLLTKKLKIDNTDKEEQEKIENKKWSDSVQRYIENYTEIDSCINQQRN